MHFCPKCGMRIVKFIKKDEKNFGICVNGHETPFDLKDLKKSDMDLSANRKKSSKSTIIVIDKDARLKEQATISMPCPRCGSRKSNLVRSFMLYGDEDQVHIMRCLNCGKNFRVGSGVSGQ